MSLPDRIIYQFGSRDAAWAFYHKVDKITWVGFPSLRAPFTVEVATDRPRYAKPLLDKLAFKVDPFYCIAGYEYGNRNPSEET